MIGHASLARQGAAAPDAAARLTAPASARRQPRPFSSGPLPACSSSSVLSASSFLAPARRQLHGQPTHVSERAARVMAAAGPSPSSQSGGLPADFQQSYVELAHRLADTAARVTTQYFRTQFDVESKADASPVTIADKQAETAMRAVLDEVVPQHGVFGEEHGLKAGSGAGARYTWVLDPIDGTKSFITGKPLFGTLISLLYDGRPILGIIDQPITRERWVGLEGSQTTLNGRPLRTRACPDIKLAYLYATTPHMFAGATESSFSRVRDAVRIPMYGCDCYAYGLLAAGQADLVVEADLKPYDYMALVPVVQGAGGVITDWEGKPLVWAPPAGASGAELRSAWPGEVLAAGDPRMHAAALQLLAWKK